MPHCWGERQWCLQMQAWKQRKKKISSLLKIMGDGNQWGRWGRDRIWSLCFQRQLLLRPEQACKSPRDCLKMIWMHCIWGWARHSEFHTNSQEMLMFLVHQHHLEQQKSGGLLSVSCIWQESLVSLVSHNFQRGVYHRDQPGAGSQHVMLPLVRKPANS